MKIRSGFVSNSSTSSFVLLGFYLDSDKFSVEDLAKKIRDEKLNPIKGIFIQTYIDNEDLPEGKIFVGTHGVSVENSGMAFAPLLPLLALVNTTREILGVSEQDYPTLLGSELDNDH